MLTIVASTNATAAPSDAIASTRQGEGAVARGADGGPGGSAAGAVDRRALTSSASGRQSRRQFGIGGERFAGGPASELDARGRSRLPFHQPDPVHRPA